MQEIGLLGVSVSGRCVIYSVASYHNKVRPGNTRSVFLCLIHYINTRGTDCVLIIYFR